MTDLYQSRDGGSLALLRNELKSNLLDSRKELTRYGMRPICPVCNSPIREGQAIALHEAIITRGDVQGADPEFRLLIHVRYNCVLVHNYWCHDVAGGEEHKIACVRQIIKFEGKRKVAEWIEDLKTRGVLPESLLHEASFLVRHVIESGC